MKFVPLDTGLETFWASRLSWRSAIALFLATTAIGLSVYSLYTAYFGQPEAYLHRSSYLSILLVLTFLVFPFKRRNWSDPLSWWDSIDFLLIVVVLVSQMHILANPGDALLRQVEPNRRDVILGSLYLFALTEATRRTVGWTMTAIIIFFLFQPLVSDHLFWIFYGPPSSWNSVVGLQFLGTDGVFGMPTMAMSNFIGLFILFGVLLQTTGGGKFFMDLAISITGRQVGGPAKAAVVSSAFMGSISGSAVANVVTTGSFTIPLMQRLGYKKEFSGGVEAAASSGGQIMPPIMGASAFLIAIFMGIPYFEVVKKATIPAVLFFFSVFMMVQFRSKREGFKVMEASALPVLKKVLKERGLLSLPPIAIVVFLGAGFTVMKAAFWGIATLFIVAMIGKKSRLSVLNLFCVLETGAKSAVPVGIACAGAGIIIGNIFISGLGLNLSSAIMGLAQGNLFLALVFTMITAIILGMGLTTVAVYMTLAALVIPSIVQIGVEPMAAHLFAFYFGVVSAITPPVALAAFAAAGISGGGPMRTGFEACKIGIASYIIPYMFVFGPGLLLVGEPLHIGMAIFTATAGVIFLAAATQGWLLSQTTPLERALLLLAALTLMKTGWFSDGVGLLAGATVFSLQYVRSRLRTNFFGWRQADDYENR